MATHYSVLAWEIPWTEEPGGLQSMRSQRVRHDLRLNNSNKYIQEYIEPYSLMFASSMWERAQLGKALAQPPCGEW